MPEMPLITEEFPLTWLSKSERRHCTFMPHALGMEMLESFPFEHPSGRAVAFLS